MEIDRKNQIAMPEKVLTRLNSWKEIAQYAGHDLRTVARWEKEYGFPVRRIGGGKGRSVFAYTEEIDEWMARMPPNGAHQEQRAVQPSQETPPKKSRFFWPAVVLFLAAALILVGFVLKERPIFEIADVQYSHGMITAMDRAGHVQWTTLVSNNAAAALRGPLGLLDIDGDGYSEVIACLEGSGPSGFETAAGGELICLSNQGRELTRVKFDGKLRIGTQSYEGPWPASAWSIVRKPLQMIFVTAFHHFTSWPAAVVAFDMRGHARGKFVNAGWIQTLSTFETPSGTRLLAGGISNSNDAGMLAVLNPENIDGSSPESDAYTCHSCGEAKPLAYFVFPRSELNVVTQSQYNQVFAIHAFSDRVAVHTLEIRQEIAGYEDRIDAIYDFGRDLRIRNAYFNDRYWDLHRRLEMEGKLLHSKADCPDRNGPRAIRKWTSERGWQDVKLPAGVD